MTRHRALVPAAVLGAAVAAGSLVAPPAQAAPGGAADPVVVTGACTGGGTWLLAARAQRRGITVVGQVAGMRPRQVWVFAASHNGGKLRTGHRVTNAQGRATVRVRTPNAPGPDTYTFTARSRGKQCSGSLVF